MIEFLFGAVFEIFGELLLWLFGEIIGSLFTTRRAFYAVSLLLIAVYIVYLGADRPAAWLRGGLLLAVAVLVDVVLAPWLRRTFGRAKLGKQS